MATDLYDAGVSAVIGHVFSGTTLAASPVYNGGPDPVAAISPSSSSPEVSTAGDYTFRICPSDLAHGVALARWIHDSLGLQRGAVLYLNDQYGRGIRQMFVREFIRRGGQLIAIDPYLGDAPEVGPYLDRMAKAGRVQFLVVAGNRGEAEEILRQAQQPRTADAGAGRGRSRGDRGSGSDRRRGLPVLVLFADPGDGPEPRVSPGIPEEISQGRPAQSAGGRHL